MKIQDLIFIAILIILIIKQNGRWFVSAGLILLALSIPLFALWIFFTAQRLVVFAWLFILLGVIVHILKSSKNNF